MTEPTDAELGHLSEKCGIGWAAGLGGMDDFLRSFARAVLAKWGTPPAVAPWRSAVLDLIDECPGLTMEQDQWLSRRVKELDFASTTQPTQAQAGAVPLSDEQILLLRFATSSLFHLFERWNNKEIPHYQLMEEMGRVVEHVIRRTEAAHGIKGGQHGADT